MMQIVIKLYIYKSFEYSLDILSIISKLWL